MLDDIEPLGPPCNSGDLPYTKRLGSQIGGVKRDRSGIRARIQSLEPLGYFGNGHLATVYPESNGLNILVRRNRNRRKVKL